MFRRLAWAFVLVLSGSPAFAETVVLDALDWGTVNVPGARGAHAVGGGGLLGEEIAFLSFDASAIEDPIVAATIRLQNPPGTFQSPQGSERFALYLSEVNTLASIEVVPASPAVLELALAESALRILERSGGKLLLNGRLITLDRPGKDRERLFDGTEEGAVPPPQLVVTTDPTGVAAPPLTLFVDGASEAEPQDGTSGAPFRRIQDALAIATPEDVVQVAPGTYTGSIGLREGVALLGSGADETTLDFTGNAGFSAVRCADGARLEGFRIVDPRPAESLEDGAIVCSGASSEIAHNRIEVGRRAAVWVQDSEAWIHHNTIRGGPDAELWSYLGALVVYGDPVVEANEIAAPQNAITILTGGASLCRNVVRGLVVVQTYDGAASDFTICDNLFLPSVAAPPLGGLIRNEYAEDDVTDVRILGNTFHDTPGIRAESGATTIANNVLVNGTAGIQIGVGADVEIRSNDVYGNRAGFMGASTNYVPIEEDQTGSNGNLSVDPDFVDVFFEDFRLRPGSPAVNAGSDDDVAGDQDLDGDERVVDVVDMGAQELQPDEELPEPALPIEVDLLPGKTPNELKFTKVAKGSGKVALAILSDDELDAPADVDVASLILDREPVLRCSERDVDRDDRRDLVCSFPLRGISLEGWPISEPPACVRGTTHAGRKLLGCDEVEIVP